MRYAAAAVSALSALPAAVAWGAEGHEAIAYVAQNLVTSEVKTKTQGILNDTSTDWLADVATWADEYRETSAGRWSEPLHFIDAQDNPPSACDVDVDRDCGADGCVVAAIANHTRRVTDASLDAEQISDALRFIVHFVGDAHQPLHNEALEVGGNDIDVGFDGHETNLHAVWDTSIVEKCAGSSTLPHAKALASTLTSQIRTGNFSKLATTWAEGMDVDQAQASALAWSPDANAYVCTNVMPDGPSPLESTDLGAAYYSQNLPVVDELLARAGYRLAAWLNVIFTGSTGGL